LLKKVFITGKPITVDNKNPNIKPENIEYTAEDFKEQNDAVAVSVREFFDEIDKTIPGFKTNINDKADYYPAGLSREDKDLSSLHLLHDIHLYLAFKTLGSFVNKMTK